MDDRQFDALTRALARGSSRRAALKGLLGGLVGGVALTTRLDRAGADDGCDCVAVPCKSLSCDTGECVYTDICTNLCTVCNTVTGACDPIVCDPCYACSRGACIGGCEGGRCCGDHCATQCCVDSDCPNEREDECGESFCNSDGLCDARTVCESGQKCCNSGTPGHYCATCCGDSECRSCQSCTGGICKDDECCGDSDCTSICGTCEEGACKTRCTGDEYCCAFANDCRKPGECCTDGHCPCGGACSDGHCYPDPPCPRGQSCCGTGADSVCKECCTDDDCTEKPCGDCQGGACHYNECCYPDHPCTEPCHTCSSSGCINLCKQGEEECCGEDCVAIGACCRESGNTCTVTDGPYTQGNCCKDLLCCPSSEGGHCAECCRDDDCPGCSYCKLGVCTDECVEGRRCCDGDCIPDDECCSVAPECPPNHFCCGKGEAGEHCAFCCEDSQCEGALGYCDDGHCYLGQCFVDSDCPGCSHCSDHTCYGECSQSQECCDGDCVHIGTCCHHEGDICGVEPSSGSPQKDCCDGLHCCYGQTYNKCAECCGDEDCDWGGTCEDWVCVYPSGCDHDSDCPKDTCCCKDGACSRKCCHHYHPHPNPDQPVITLPATGSGVAPESSGILGASALGVAAAALLAARKLRADSGAAEPSTGE